jgi:hypothetical protein
MTTGGKRDLAGLTQGDWLTAIDEIGEERGYFQPLGAAHWAIFTDEAPILLVTFETIASARARPDQRPLGFELADARGWSQLTLLAEGASWFRDPRVYGFFDRLVDDGFFEDFDRVIFLGGGMCGYAAAAFSVVAPGATVLAVQPQATLDPLRAGWDRRFLKQRRLNFTDRYGFAPHMIEAADRAFLFFDPKIDADAIHAAFFTCPNTELVRMPGFGADILSDLLRMGALDKLLDLAASPDGLTAAGVHQALRARGSYLPYLRNLVGRLAAEQQWMRLATVTRHLSRRFGGRRFQKAHAEALARLKAEGRSLPARMRAQEPAEAL